MGYISAIRKRDTVLVWERTEKGRELKFFEAPYEFFIEDSSGDYEGLYGERLERHTFSTYEAFNTARKDFESSGMQVYESDIPSELKVLSELYYNQPAPKPNVTFFDIEVDYNDQIGFADTTNPYAPVNSVSLYHQHRNKYVVYVVPPPGWEPRELVDPLTGKPLSEIAEINICESEIDLLLNFLVEIEDSDTIVGWNSEWFDTPYLCKRIEKVLGKSYLQKMSFDQADMPRFTTREVFNREQIKVELSGRNNCDFLALFRKFEQDERRSYKLESIADEILPDLPKIKYEGTLHRLYRNDFDLFVRYNIRDTEILHGLERVLGYVALANELYHISTGTYRHVEGTIRLAELSIINYCHHVLGVRVPDTREPGDPDSIKGALVLTPKVGLHHWVGGIDINSLYPSSIRSLNVSPETIRGQFDVNYDNFSIHDRTPADEIAKGSLAQLTLRLENGEKLTKSADEWRGYLQEKKWAVSGYGTVFSQEKQGVIPAILEDWFATRKLYQKKKAESEGETREYYDRLQYIFKIKLNSLYGALSNQFFKFYDLRMGESVTATGRRILRHQCAKANEILTGEYNLEGDAVIYGDTDSTYFDTSADNLPLARKIADAVAKKVNESFPEFMRNTFLCTEGYDNIIRANREIISDSGIYIDKKRYFLHLVDLDGADVDKLKVMGVDTKKTILPKDIADKLNNFVERFLKGEDWDIIANDIVNFKESLKNSEDIMLIGLPKGITGVEKYTKDLAIYGDGQRLPGHVAAAIHYNQMLEQVNDRESPPIVTGMKIKVFYLTQNVGRFKSIALPTDIEVIPQWFYDTFEINTDAQLERLVDNPLQNIIKAIGKDVPSKQSLVVDSLIDF